MLVVDPCLHAHCLRLRIDSAKVGLALRLQLARAMVNFIYFFFPFFSPTNSSNFKNRLRTSRYSVSAAKT